jgi:hypothetical protein
MGVCIAKIVSGGQSGADIGALDAAIHCGVPHGGWCPRGRKQERRRRIPERYQLTEMDSPDYLKRTRANVVDSDATLILTFGPLGGGSLRTLEFARQYGKPSLHIDLEQSSRAETVAAVRRWFAGELPGAQPPCGCILNVAGNRASSAPGIEQAVMVRMVDILTDLNRLTLYPLNECRLADSDPDYRVECDQFFLLFSAEVERMALKSGVAGGSDGRREPESRRGD